MRLVPFVFVMLLLVSCGQDGQSSSSSNRRGICDLNGSSVECSAIEGADGLGIDLLNAIIDVPVKIHDSDITFSPIRQLPQQEEGLHVKRVSGTVKFIVLLFEEKNSFS